jgi:hypothetical protein
MTMAPETARAEVVRLPRHGKLNDEAKLLFALLTLLESADEVGRVAAESYLRLCAEGKGR